MKKKISIQIICAILLFLTGFACGGYRGTYRFSVQRNAADLLWYNTFHMLASKGDNEKIKTTSAQCVNMVVGILRESESGDLSSAYWLNAFSVGVHNIDDKNVALMLKSNAKYPISNVTELTKENMEYLKSKQK